MKNTKNQRSIAVVSIYPERGTVHPEAGGVASYTHNLCTALVESGDDVSVVCNIESGDQPQQYDEGGVHVHRTFKKNFLFFWDIAKTVRRIRPDTVHFQQELSLYGGIVSAFLLPFAVALSGRSTQKVVTLHGVVSPRQVDQKFVEDNNSNAPAFLVRFAFFALYALLNWSASRIIVHEAPFKQRLVEEYHVNPRKVFIIPHGIELTERMATNEARKQLNIDEKKKVLLFVGYLTGYKGIDLLIEGFARYLKDNPDNDTLLLIGAGKHPKLKDDPKYLEGSYNRLQQKAATLLPANSYRWAGFIPESELQVYYSAADVSIYPYTVAMSSSGPMAMSIAYRTPFIASDVFSEYFNYEHHFFDRNEKSLADTIVRVLNMPGHNELIETLRRERAWPAVAMKHIEVYSPAKEN